MEMERDITAHIAHLLDSGLGTGGLWLQVKKVKAGSGSFSGALSETSNQWPGTFCPSEAT